MAVIHPELTHYLRCLQRIIYVVTEDEDQFLRNFHKGMTEYESQTYVYNAAFGLQPIAQIIEDWTKRAHPEDSKTMSFIDAMTKIYKDEPKQIKITTNEGAVKGARIAYYLITDPDVHLNNSHNVRRVLNLAHQFRNNDQCIKVLIFVGHTKVIPPKLSQYVEVATIKGLPDNQMDEIVTMLTSRMKVRNADNKPVPVDVPENINKYLKGMSAHMIEQAIISSTVKTKEASKTALVKSKDRILPEHLLDYKRRQLQKTDLLTYLDTSEFSFDQIGGLDRLKTWAKKVKEAWTDEGEAFGLQIPRGVFLVGVFGCGKTLFTKALGNAWGLPVISMSLGRMRGSLVGESESNLRRALAIIESVAPCIVQIDEAEKEFSGSATGTNDAGVSSRILGQLSTWIQDRPAKVCFAMTSNSIDNFPPEILNRMDERFFVDLPTEEDRIDILKIHLRLAGQDPTKCQSLVKLSKAAQGLVGREIEQAIQAAMRESYYQKLDGLSEAILTQELERKPRIILTMEAEIKKILDWVGYDPVRDEGIRAKFASDHGSDRFKSVKG